ncbi:MAG: (Fe-S)-binding protein [Candidatus Freyarchaeota archaeon]
MNFNGLADYLQQMEKCGRCGDCAYSVKISTAKKHISMPCPIRNILGFETYSARGRIIILKKLLEGELDIDPSIVQWANLCLTCASCKETCLAIEGGIDVPSMMECLRRELVDAGYFLDSHASIQKNVIEKFNPYGEDHQKRREFLDSISIPEKADIVYFVGCTSSYRRKEIAKSTIELLHKSGIDFTILDDERCCGSTLFRTGFVKTAKEFARYNIDKINEVGAKTVVFSCAGCYRTFAKDYASLWNGTKIKLMHIVELLKKLKDQNKISFASPKKIRVTYHDPCHLGRHMNVFEEPRNLLKATANVELVEMKTNRRYAHCCGAGSGVKKAFPDIAVRISKERLIEAAETQAEVLVSACPFCKTNLIDGADSTGLSVMDITEFLLNNYTSESKIAQELQEQLTLGQRFMKYLDEHPNIFADLVKDSIVDFSIFDSLESFESEKPPLEAFHVVRTEYGIKINNSKANAADVEIAFSQNAVKNLVSSKDEKQYAKRFGKFYNEPTEETWIDFLLNRSTRVLIKMGYGKFAREAGILEDEDAYS